MSLRASQGQILTSEKGDKQISLYTGQLEPVIVLQCVNRLRVAFPKMSDEFFNILSERVVANSFSNERLQDAVNYVIDNFQYKELNVSDVIKFDKRAKLYSYNEVCNLVTKGKASFSDFQVITIKDKTYRVKKSDLVQ